MENSMENMHADLMVLGCKGLKTSCNQYMWSIAWIYDWGKCKCPVNIILLSSTLEGALCTKKLKFSAFTSFFG